MEHFFLMPTLSNPSLRTQLRDRFGFPWNDDEAGRAELERLARDTLETEARRMPLWKE